MRLVTLLLLTFILSASASFAQDKAELARRNGFKEIKLGTPIDSVKGASYKKEIKEKNEFPAKLFEVQDEKLMKIGEVRVKRIELKTYKDIVYEIGVITDKDTRLMKGMVKSFGQPTYILTTDSYNWLTDDLSLTFRDYSKNEIKLTYRSYPVLKMMVADKGKKIDDIAEDF
jgi:hypothetical protein